MSVALLGLVAGLGCVGILYGARAVHPSLESIARVAGRPAHVVAPRAKAPGPLLRLSSAWVDAASARGLLRHPRWVSLSPALAITATPLEQLAARALAGAGAGLMLPPVLWAGAGASGLSIPIAFPVALSTVMIPLGVSLPFLMLLAGARDRRNHFRIVIGTYVDLVVLSLAGGVGIEGALLSAAEVSTDWAAKRLSKALLLARDTGEPAWEVLGRVGEQLAVPELIELAATLQLAGTEGARVRQSLSARAVSLRRHEQADAESAANAMTERLFFPGALLLLGFLLFIGYPAFSRILTGF
ncbi:MAG: type II secretion system F family protein [Acidimicrobiales bacterium]